MNMDVQVKYIVQFRIVFWDVLPCKMIVDWRFRGAYCLHHHLTRQYIPEDNSEHHTRRRENLKSRIFFSFILPWNLVTSPRKFTFSFKLGRHIGVFAQHTFRINNCKNGRQRKATYGQIEDITKDWNYDASCMLTSLPVLDLENLSTWSLLRRLYILKTVSTQFLLHREYIFKTVSTQILFHRVYIFKTVSIQFLLRSVHIENCKHLTFIA
jgi:hypothetical protein